MTSLWFTLALILGILLILERRRANRQAQEQTERCALEKNALKIETEEAQRETRRLLDSFPDPLFSISQKGTIIRANQAGRNYFGSRDILNRTCTQVFIDDTLTAAIKSARKSNQTTSTIIRLPSGSPFSAGYNGQQSIWEISFRPFSIQRDSQELQLFMRDITDETRTDQIRQDFVANASHELRTPLSIISGYLEHLTEPDGLNNPAMASKMLGTMDRHVERINRIIEDMLVISQLESGESAPLKKEPFSLNECVQDVIERLDLVIQKQNATVTTGIPEIPFTGDRFYWTQILFNLIENALKQNTSQQVTVSVEAKQIAPNQLQITVSDDGIGIPNDDLPFIFKRFFRVEKHHAQSQIKGTGLGLSIVKRAVEAHGGTITATSSPGRATTFTIQTPC
ncbi:MAG: sensor histidine kinase [Verrucomicrobiaceae bacterium]